SLRSRITSARYGPRIVEFFHSAFWSVPDTTYFVESFMNGAPGSSSAVRPDQAGANISNVRRPRSSPSLAPMIAPIASPIFGSNGYPAVQRGSSMTPSSLMNSCTAILPMISSLQRLSGRPRPQGKIIASSGLLRRPDPGVDLRARRRHGSRSRAGDRRGIDGIGDGLLEE